MPHDVRSIDDDSTAGFFARGRDFEAASDAHSYTIQERAVLASFESLEYLPPNNVAYRDYLSNQTQQSPSLWSRWLAMGMIGFSVGAVSFTLKSTIDRLCEFRRSLLFDAECRGDQLRPGEYECGAVVNGDSASHARFGATLTTLFPISASISVAFACAAACVVVFIQPAAASSGIPEVIAYLNGTHQRKIFNIHTLVAKFVSCVLAVGSGLPVGPEGPMIHMGAIIGRSVSQMQSATLGCALPLFSHFRNNKDARDCLTAGAAAGAASAFGAPVGGLLFALEEVASTWSQTLTWQIFFCAMSAATTTIVLSSAFGGFQYSGRLGQLQAGGPRASIEFYIDDPIDLNVLLFVPSMLIGCTCGLLGALFTFLNLKVTRFRRRHIAPRRVLRVVEPMLNMLLLACLTFGLTVLYPCTDAAEFAHPVSLEVGMLIRLYCPVGQYNELASLMYASGHHAVLLLLSRRDVSGHGRLMFSCGSVATFLLVYFCLACCAAGSAISSGLVVPMLLIGACIGRLYGILSLAIINQPISLSACNSTIDLDGLPPQCAYSFVDPGAFALIGAAAFFSGVSRLTIALTVIMIEITNDVRFLLPIMLAVMVAKWVADGLTHSLYHGIIETKCLPFLNAEIALHGSLEGDLERFNVADLLQSLSNDKPSQVVTMRAGHGETFGSCAKKLGQSQHGAYPVVDDEGRLQGTVTRSQLYAVFVAAAHGVPNGEGGGIQYLELLAGAEAAAMDAAGTASAINSCATDPGLSLRPCDLTAYTNASAFSVRDTFSIHRAYMLFRTMGLRHLVVTDSDNRVVGVLTRRDLMDFQLHELLRRHGHRNRSSGSGQGASTAQSTISV